LLIDFTLSQLIMRACAVLFVSTVQGLAMAAAAGALGDQGPRHDRRLSLDPLRHVDVLGGLVALVFSIGWAKWIAIDPRALRHGRIDLVLVLIAGLAAVLLAVVLLRLARPFLLPLLPDTAASTAFELIRTTIEIGTWFVVLGLVPVPPLAGGQLIVALMPRLRDRLRGAQLLIGLVFAALIAAGVVTSMLDPIFRMLSGLVS
jgi:Zn-dependent protease